MKTITFICVLVISVSVYAKTEAGLNMEGFGKKNSQQRNLAAETIDDMNIVLAQLNRVNSKPQARSITADSTGFSGNNGALTKAKKKSAVSATADSNGTK